MIQLRRPWLGRLNWYVLRWLFVRLAVVMSTDDSEPNKWVLLLGMWPSTGYNETPLASYAQLWLPSWSIGWKRIKGWWPYGQGDKS